MKKRKEVIKKAVLKCVRKKTRREMKMIKSKVKQ